jgi:hypothetical protein
MQIELVQRKLTAAEKLRCNSVYGFVSEMPDMDSGPPTNITIEQPDNVAGYTPDITVIKPQESIIIMDAVSAYPPELISKYSLPIGNGGDNSWIWLPIKCEQCKRNCSYSFLGETGICYYCRNGIR